jgi:hypothetical protein
MKAACASSGHRRRKVFSFLAMVFLAIGVAATGHGKEIDDLHALILRNPSNIELNLRFARVAEASGIPRWALAAYERVLAEDPQNLEARQGIQRILRGMQPSFTLVTAELGAAYESNPRLYLPPKRGELLGIGSLSLRDERYVANTRWRTSGLLAGQVHQKNSELNYGYAGFETGPVIDLAQAWRLHPALGAAAAYFDHHFFYSEASASATFEGSFDGALQALRLRAAYRKYDDFFPSSEGFYADIRGRFAALNVLGDGSIAFLSPWVLWSNISGSVINVLVTELQPGAYLEWGARLEVYKSLAPWLTVGANVSAARRSYRNDVVPGTGDTREDIIFIPGATLIFPNLIAAQTDLRLDYKFIDDHSNDPAKRFTDHFVSATVVSRFDPFAPAMPVPR